MSFYKSIVRPVLFLFSQEWVHDLASVVLGAVGKSATGQWLLKKLFAYRHPALEREVFGVKFANPIGAAAGLDRDARLYRQLGALGFGFVEVGSVTPKPQHGGTRPRMFRISKQRALVSRMENPNCGLVKAIKHLRRRAYGQRVVVGANIAPNQDTHTDKIPTDYLKLFRNLYQYVDYFTVNVGTIMTDAESYSPEQKALVERSLNLLFDFRRGQEQYRPIMLKVSPDWNRQQIDDMVQILIDTPLDGLVVADSSTRLGCRLNERQLEKMSGGRISGTPLIARTAELVDYVCRKTDYSYPIIGVGGVMSPEDAQRLLDAGASLVQTYTGVVFNGPKFPSRICRFLAQRSKSVQ